MILVQSALVQNQKIESLGLNRINVPAWKDTLMMALLIAKVIIIHKIIFCFIFFSFISYKNVKYSAKLVKINQVCVHNVRILKEI